MPDILRDREREREERRERRENERDQNFFLFPGFPGLTRALTRRFDRDT